MVTSRALVAACALLSACKLISFDVKDAIAEQTVPGSPLGGLLGSLFPTAFKLDIDVKSETDARGTGPASAANLKSLTLFITPQTSPKGNFDFVDEVHVFVAAPSDTTLPKKEIATLSPVPKGKTTVEFTVTPDVDLLPYINKGAEISTTASGTQPSDNRSFAGEVTITIKI